MQKVIFAVAVALVVAGCSGKKETPKGYEFEVVEAGDGPEAEVGKALVLELYLKDANDSIWYDNRGTEYPDLVLIQDTSYMKNEAGVAEIFRMMSEGDSIHFQVGAKELFERTYRMAVPPQVNPQSKFTYYFKVKDIVDSTEAQAMRAKLMLSDKRKNKEAIEQTLAEQAQMPQIKEQLAKDSVIIDDYLKKKSLTAQTAPNGVRYVIRKEGDGATPELGDIAYVKYSGYLLNGKEFDAGTYPVKVGEYGVVVGWETAIAMMKKGSVMTVIIPSSWAYGPRAQGPDIPENSVLAFEMELVDLKKNY
jgi:FKBP-type peptidyl-prolyl cis-trans isomerase